MENQNLYVKIDFGKYKIIKGKENGYCEEVVSTSHLFKAKSSVISSESLTFNNF